MRLFLALDLDAVARDAVAAEQRRVAQAIRNAGGAELRWVPPERLHVTLLFLGEVDERQLPDLCRAVADCCAQHQPFSLSIETVGCFPNPRRPRVVWVGVGEGAQEVAALHDGLEPPLLEPPLL